MTDNLFPYQTQRKTAMIPL